MAVGRITILTLLTARNMTTLKKKPSFQCLKFERMLLLLFLGILIPNSHGLNNGLARTRMYNYMYISAV